jgi:aerobic carbon-monoxide dehydrogenase medium subunit
VKPAAFQYHAPHTVAELLELLAAHGDDGKILAGGQSLVPMMNFRLARPERLFDINGITELDYLRAAGPWLHIGALQRHAAFGRPVVGGPLGRLLTDVQEHIAHYPIRERGTLAGSLAHADPAAEWCLVAATLDAEIVARSRSGERTLKSGDFFLGTFATRLQPDEVLAEVRLPILDASWRCGFSEFSRRVGDFALAMTLALVRIDRGAVSAAHIGIGGVAEQPLRVGRAEAALLGNIPTPALIAEVADIVSGSVEPMQDIHASAPYRRDLLRTTTRRALERALDSLLHGRHA